MARKAAALAADVSPGDAAIYEITLNVVGYKEHGEWAAIALEMDLRGFGSSFQDAVQNLMELVRIQVSFAHFKGQPEMVLKPAEPVWWERFAEVRREHLDALIRERSRPDTSFDIAGIRIPAAYAIAQFSQSEA
jgi:hypothetical protein